MKLVSTENNEFRPLLIEDTGTLYATLKTDKLEQMQNYLCKEIQNITIEGKTMVNGGEWSFSIEGAAIIFDGETYEATKGEMLHFFPEYEKLTKLVVNSKVLKFILYSGDGIIF